MQKSTVTQEKFKKCFGGISNVLDLITTRNTNTFDIQSRCVLFSLLEPVDDGEEFVFIHSEAPNNEKLKLCFGPMVGEP